MKKLKVRLFGIFLVDFMLLFLLYFPVSYAVYPPITPDLQSGEMLVPFTTSFTCDIIGKSIPPYQPSQCVELLPDCGGCAFIPPVSGLAQMEVFLDNEFITNTGPLVFSTATHTYFDENLFPLKDAHAELMLKSYYAGSYVEDWLRCGEYKQNIQVMSEYAQYITLDVNKLINVPHGFIRITPALSNYKRVIINDVFADGNKVMVEYIKGKSYPPVTYYYPLKAGNNNGEIAPAVFAIENGEHIIQLSGSAIDNNDNSVQVCYYSSVLINDCETYDLTATVTTSCGGILQITSSDGSGVGAAVTVTPVSGSGSSYTGQITATGLVFSNVIPGQYNVQATKSGYVDFTGMVAVSSGVTSTVDVVLQQLGSLSITSTPKGANVYLGNTLVGTTSQSTGSFTIALAPNVYNIKITKSGYVDYIAPSVTLTSGQTTTINAVLSPLTGTLSVTSTPAGANVEVDGVLKGVTPATGSLSIILAQGKYSVKVTKTGYADYTNNNVNIVADQTTTINAILSPKCNDGIKVPEEQCDGNLFGTETCQTKGFDGGNLICTPNCQIDTSGCYKFGTLHVTSTPAGANVCVDNNCQWVTPALGLGTMPGTHTIKLTKSGYQDYIVTVTISSGETKTLDVVLVQLLGGIFVTSTPSGASVYVDELLKGNSPIAVTGLSPGPHAVKVTAEGYDNYIQTVTITAGQTATVNAVLVLKCGNGIIDTGEQCDDGNTNDGDGCSSTCFTECVKEVQITTNPLYQQQPSIYGDKIVWQDNRNGNYDIYMYDLTTKTETQITTNSLTQYSPSIYQDKIVWQDNRNGNSDIYMYDLTTKTETQITTNPLYQEYPSIYGDKIVWHDNRNGNLDIYMYDLATKQETQITTDPLWQRFPSIYGDKIVWQDTRNGNEDIYMYDLTTKTETPITTHLVYQHNPSIYGDKIVWQENRNGNLDIYMYDLTTKTETQITTNTAHQTYPSIYQDKIVWEDKRNGNWDIYMYDLTTKTETQITTNSLIQYYPSIYQDKIVWEDYRNGNPDIYMYDLSCATTPTPAPLQTSSITNKANQPVNGQLTLKAQKQGSWIDYETIIDNKPFSIGPGASLSLTDLWDGFIVLEPGNYRVLAEFKVGDTVLSDNYEFIVEQPQYGPPCGGSIPCKGTTTNLSIWMVRNSENFNFDGPAYLISPHAELNQEATLEFNDPIYSNGLLEEKMLVYRYETLPTDCEVQIIGESKSVIGAGGGEMSSNDNLFKVGVSQGALTGDTEFTITNIYLKCNNEDLDSDGVNDEEDVCLNTPLFEPVYEGCSCSQIRSYSANDDIIKDLNEKYPGIYGICEAKLKGAGGEGITGKVILDLLKDARAVPFILLAMSLIALMWVYFRKDRF